jgi:hypothetical protein
MLPVNNNTIASRLRLLQLLWLLEKIARVSAQNYTNSSEPTSYPSSSPTSVCPPGEKQYTSMHGGAYCAAPCNGSGDEKVIAIGVMLGAVGVLVSVGVYYSTPHLMKWTDAEINSIIARRIGASLGLAAAPLLTALAVYPALLAHTRSLSHHYACSNIDTDATSKEDCVDNEATCDAQFYAILISLGTAVAGTFVGTVLAVKIAGYLCRQNNVNPLEVNLLNPVSSSDSSFEKKESNRSVAQLVSSQGDNPRNQHDISLVRDDVLESGVQNSGDQAIELRKVLS